MMATSTFADAHIDVPSWHCVVSYLSKKYNLVAAVNNGCTTALLSDTKYMITSFLK